MQNSFESLPDLLPLVDVYIAHFNSSTIIWSVLCRIPFIQLNPLGQFIDSANSIIGPNIINDMRDFDYWINSFTKNNEEFLNIYNVLFEKFDNDEQYFTGQFTNNFIHKLQSIKTSED